ncbi:MAG TPA: twin-arginine translocase TatA/TatE family subunit [Marmoricola sp.]|nr:twin-arginine translocase TatA/TatE family subunit [Marmoricola sp.]
MYALSIRNLFEGWDLLIILAIVVLLFGSTKLPELARGMGRSIRIFKSEMDDGKGDKNDAEPTQIEATAETSESLKTEPAKSEEPQTK